VQGLLLKLRHQPVKQMTTALNYSIIASQSSIDMKNNTDTLPAEYYKIASVGGQHVLWQDVVRKNPS
jgi:hypothetical protein